MINQSPHRATAPVGSGRIRRTLLMLAFLASLATAAATATPALAVLQGHSMYYYWNIDGTQSDHAAVLPGSAGNTYSAPAIVHNDHNNATEIAAEGSFLAYL